MAQTLANPPLSRALGWVARPPPAVRYGLKLGTGTSAAIWIGFASGLDWGLSIWTTVMFIMEPNRGASIKKSLMRFLGTVGSALICIVLYGLFAQQPPLMLAGTCGVIALAVYGMTGPRYQYAWLTFGFTTIIILLKAMEMEGTDQIETLSFERASMAALGVVIVFVADALFWPVRAEQELREGLAERGRHLGDSLKQHLDALLSGDAPGDPGPPPSSPLIPQLGLAEQAGYETGVTPSQAQGLSRIALLLEGLASRARLLERECRTEPSPASPSVRAALSRLGEDLEAALGDASRALAADHAPQAFAADLDHSMGGFDDERLASPGAGAPLSGLAAVLRDIVRLLRSLEEALLGLAKGESPTSESKAEATTPAAPAAIKEWFRLDPIRFQLAVRAGIAGGGLLVAMLVMGWTFSEDTLGMILGSIVAFILAAASTTRGAATKLAIGVAAGVLLGWLIANLASIFLFTHVARMPLSLVYPFAVAGGTGYLVVRGSFLGPLGAVFGMTMAIVPVFITDFPVPNVDVNYGLACGMLLGVATAVIAQRALWPRTAMQIFTARAAGQLDLCLRAVRGAARGPGAAGIVSGYAKQLTMLGQIHAQAHVEPVERALDDTRRSDLLALIQDLFDASLRTPLAPAAEEEPATDAALAPLHAALGRQDEALVASLAAVAEALRGPAPGPGSELDEARAAVEAQLDALRGEPDVDRALGTRPTDALLASLGARRLLVARQLAIEAWLADWQRAAGADTGA